MQTFTRGAFLRENTHLHRNEYNDNKKDVKMLSVPLIEGLSLLLESSLFSASLSVANCLKLNDINTF